MHSFFTENLGLPLYAYTYTHTYVWCVAERVCKCVCVYVFLKRYTYCTVLRRTKGCFWPCNLCHFWVCQVLPVPVAASPTVPLSMQLWLTLVMMNCSRNSLPVLVVTGCLNLGAGLHVPEQLLCQMRLQECEVSGLSLVKQRRAAFSLEFAPSTISRG